MAYRSLVNRCVRTSQYPLCVRLSSTTQTGENIIPAKSFKEKARDTWNGPTFKYWLIGGTGFLSWLTYYSWKAYKNKCIDVELSPPMTNHLTLDRASEIGEILRIHAEQGSFFDKKLVKKILVNGPPASGKTTLVTQVVHRLRDLHSNKIGLPVSTVSLFLSADNEFSFLISLKAAASKLEIKASDLDEVMKNGLAFNQSPFEDQCVALMKNIQEKLSNHPGWVLVFDQIQSTSPKTILDVINTCLEEDGLWSSGTMILVGEGIDPKLMKINDNVLYQMKTGLSKDDSVALLKKVINVDGDVRSLNKLAERVFSNPLALLCAGIIMKKKLSLKESRSIDDVVDETCTEIENYVKKVLQNNKHLAAFTTTLQGLKLVTIETLVTMVLKDIMQGDLYLKNGIDLLASLAPGTSVPQTLITRHLSSSFYQLPSVAKRPNILDFMNKQKRDVDEVKEHADEYDPKGKAWSNKNLAHYMRKIEDFFQTAYKTIKDIYNLVYGELPQLPEGDDGMGMFEMCDLIQSNKLEPGNVKSFSLHPLVYNAARQHFLSKTALEIESKHVEATRHYHEHKSWYRKMSTFSEQATLQQFRNSIGIPSINKNLTEDDANKLLFRYNLGIDVSSVFKDGMASKDSEYWKPKNVDLTCHLQDHIGRTIGSLCEQLNNAKGDVAGHTSKKVLLVHLEYLLRNQPFELIGSKNQAKCLLNLAKGYASVYRDAEANKQLLDQVITIQQADPNTEPLEMAESLTEKAQYFISQENYESAKSLLLEVSEIYESQRRKLGEYKQPIKYGQVLGRLGAVYGSLGMKVESKETIERALMMEQSIPPDMSDDEKSKKFGSDFASTLIDLGHAYVSLGLPLYGKKILDLALNAQKNLNGENHPEVVRAMTVLAVAHLMQGHNEESRKLRKEAGKLQAAINKIPMY